VSGSRSKSVAAWLALTLGTLGAHRFYLRGWRDALAWLHIPPSLLGLAGVVRLRNLGQDDQVAWLLIPLLGLMLSAAMLTAIVYALTPDERWAEKHSQPLVATTWAPVFAAVLALFFGGAVLMGTIAYGGQKFFEWQLESAAADATALQKSKRLSP
jgi:TM2 domain